MSQRSSTHSAVTCDKVGQTDVKMLPCSQTFTPQVFDHLQYANKDGEGLGDLVRGKACSETCSVKAEN